MKKIIFTLILLIILSTEVYSCPIGGPHLWLSTDPNRFDVGGIGYVYGNANPWMSESYVTNNNPFRMYLYNALQNKEAQDAIKIGLIIAIHSGESGIVTVKDEFGYITVVSKFTYTNVNPYYGGGYHGVYQNPENKKDPQAGDAVFAIYRPSKRIDLSSGEATWFDIETSGLSEVHFDAFSCNRFYNPPSHDVDAVIPEPATLSLLGLGLLGIAAGRRRKSGHRYIGVYKR